MKRRHWLVLGAALALACCGPHRQPQEPAKNSGAAALPLPSAPPAVANKAVPAPAPAEKPTVDPKSSEAALDLVRGLVDLLNRGKFDEAYMLLGAGAPPRTDFDRHFSKYSDLKVSVGNAGDQEGAAGSIYLSVPITVSGNAKGEHVSRSATVILRRVNDVPGSTEAQRHWHIQRIDWEDAIDGG
jgi:hypothetical protein